jgi:hypothetical protein
VAAVASVRVKYAGPYPWNNLARRRRLGLLYDPILTKGQ